MEGLIFATILTLFIGMIMVVTPMLIRILTKGE